ncbi:MAG: S9 family peptidase [Candidatus Kapabacteria bacterium]|jgi:dipeptidyl aminopeptidase/acylaminoacyl peptidase|nr:S9 family peptidase [Candidatus Kapabacteria bacterium]
MRTPLAVLFLLAAAIFYLGIGQVLTAQPQATKRPIQPSDLYRLQSVGDPQISPDGKWLAYTLSSVDSAQDKRGSDIWMISWDGTETLQITHTKDESERSPRWSPDGKYLSFVASRGGADKKSQVWLLDRRGGEAFALTNVKSDLNDYAWSPDGKKLVLVLKDVNPLDSAKPKTAPPIVTERYHFKQDVEGYLWRTEKTHLYLFDVGTKKLDTLTRGTFDDRSPQWSPDGSQIAFVSNRTPDPDYNNNTDIWIIEAKAGAKERQLTTWQGSDDNPRWSPDGTKIAYTRSTSPDYIMYDQPVLTVIAAKGGEPTPLSLALDRPVSRPLWAADGQTLYATVTDDRRRSLAQFSLNAGKAPVKIIEENSSVGDIVSVSLPKQQLFAAVVSNPQLPGEIYALEQNAREQGKLRRLTKHHDAFLAPLALASVEGFTSKSKDGAEVSGLLFRPSNATKGQKLPLILFIHGGPVGQDEWGFDVTRQILASGGYAVAAVNYRGSNGRGLAFCKAISGDWGNKEVLDLHGAVDYLVAEGIADSARLGVGGWSYGGILTDYLIATDIRFKAAASGAGTALHLATYGTDQYIRQYETELGVPWKNLDKWLQLSYPFLKADRIKTPTLFMAGEKDFNVPAAGSEQLYQALRSQNIPTQLVIYPGQFHGLTVPSYNKDRLERYLKWFDKYVKK